MKFHTVALFIVSAAMSSSAMSTASGASNRYHAAHCVLHGDDGDGIKRSPNYGAGNISSGTAQMSCPVDDVGSFGKQDATTFVVDVRDHSSSSSVLAAACVDFRGGTGGSCGFAEYSGSSFVGFKSLVRTTLQTDTLRPWVTYYGDFGYLQVSLPGGSPSAYSSVRGYKVGY